MIRGRRIRLRPGIVVPVAALVVIAAAALIALPKLTGGSGSASGKLASVKLAPEPWEGRAKPKYRSEEALQRAAPWDTPSPRTAPGAIDPKTGMPAASAGSNGSYSPPSPAERKRVYTATHPVGGVDSALLLNRTALAPASAPDPIRQMISAANQIVGQPYVWGGGHASFQSKGYDCSGAVSYALAGAGLLRAPHHLRGIHELRDTGAGPLAHHLRELGPRLRGDRRPALGHGRRRSRLGPALASRRCLSAGFRGEAPARPLVPPRSI